MIRRLVLGLLMVQPVGECFSAAARGAFDVRAALASVSEGDTIIVPAGLHPGNLIVEKRLVLIADGQVTLRGDGTGSVVTITADSCVLRGFRIERSGRDLMHEDAGILICSNGNLIEQNNLSDILFGIYLLEADGNVVRNNTVIGRSELDLGQRGSGIHIWNSHRNAFSGNIISHARDGFYLQYAHHTHIERNEVHSLRYGLHYMYADSNVFLHNTFYDNVAGAAVMYSRGIKIRHNAFVRNRGFASFGILFQDCHGMVVDSNVVADNVVGMFFEATTGNLFRHNVIAQNDAALQMFQNSVRNTFTENNFIDNLTPLLLVGKRTEAVWSHDGRGNYWSSYDGYDLDGDGVGDIPMKVQNVFQFLEGQYPNVRLYLYSPASQALAVAAQAFPIIAINTEQDDFPLMQPVRLGGMPAVQLAQRPDHTSASGWIIGPVSGVVMLGVAVVRRFRRASS